MMSDLVSIIMPVFNCEKYIGSAIESVLKQSHNNWELLIVNDGSTDKSGEVVLVFKDRRIRYFTQPNSGVASARNVGLRNMTGSYFCFLDSDDLLPEDSLKSRLDVFNINSSIYYVDGNVCVFDETMETVLRKYSPTFRGNPLEELFQLSAGCFFGASWMIKRKPGFTYQFNTTLTHGEDLLFFMELAKQGGTYDFTKKEVLRYRKHAGSAMLNLDGLLNGYRSIYNEIKTWEEFTWKYRIGFKMKTKKIMFLSYAKQGMYKKSIKALLWL